MAVESAKERHQKRDGSIQTSGSEVTLRRHWKVKTTLATDDAITIMNSGYLPAKGAPHPSYSSAIADRFSITPGESAKLWDAVVEYSTISGGNLPQNQPFQPTLRLAQISWGTAQFRRPMERAYFVAEGFSNPESNPSPVVNSAGVPFSPPPEMDDSRPTVTVTKNLASTPLWILNYQDAVNWDEFLVDGVQVPLYCAKMQAIHISPLQMENNFLFRQASMVIQFRRDTWKEPILDRGWTQWVFVPQLTSNDPPAGYRRQRMFDCEGLPITEPALLDGHGKQLLPINENTIPVYRTYMPYVRMPFSDLPLS